MSDKKAPSEQRDDREAQLEALVRRAAPFVNAVVVMAENRTPGLTWLADASLVLDPEGAFLPKDRP